MISFLDVAAPDPIEPTSNVNLYIVIGLAVLLVALVVVSMIVLNKKKRK